MKQFRHLLVAVDFDDSSIRALTLAVEIARVFGARLTVMHAYALPVLGALLDETEAAARSTVAKAVEANRSKLDALVAEHCPEGVEAEALLTMGAAVEQIVEQAKALDVDLVIVGTHGRNAIGRALLGSVALGVLRASTVPVFTVRAPLTT